MKTEQNKQMIQTGDPLGDGTGGESIWGGTFEDEISPKVNYNAPYMLAMANAGKSAWYWLCIGPSKRKVEVAIPWIWSCFDIL